MKRILVTRFVAILIALVLLAACSPPPEPQVFAPQPIEDLIEAASILLASLIGIPAFLSGILALLEFYGKITSEGADQIQMIANIVLYLASFIFVAVGNTTLLQALDHYLGGIAPILAAILLFLSGGIHSIIQMKRYAEKLPALVPVYKEM